MKFCKDCIYRNKPVFDTYSECTHTSAISNINPITGHILYIGCLYMRNTKCENGALFEPKVSTLQKVFKCLKTKKIS